MGHFIVPELDLAPFEAGSGECATSTEFDVSDLGGADRLHS